MDCEALHCGKTEIKKVMRTKAIVWFVGAWSERRR